MKLTIKENKGKKGTRWGKAPARTVIWLHSPCTGRRRESVELVWLSVRFPYSTPNENRERGTSRARSAFGPQEKGHGCCTVPTEGHPCHRRAGAAGPTEGKAVTTKTTWAVRAARWRVQPGATAHSAARFPGVRPSAGPPETFLPPHSALGIGEPSPWISV